MARTFVLFRRDMPQVSVYYKTYRDPLYRNPYVFFYSEAAVVGAILRCGIYGNLGFYDKTRLDLHFISNRNGNPVEESFYLFLRRMIGDKFLIFYNDATFLTIMPIKEKVDLL